LQAARETDFSALALQSGVSVETMRRQLMLGLDNPAYRFRRDQGLYDFLAAHRADLASSSWLDVGADTGAVSIYLSEILKSETFALCDVNVAKRTNFPVRQFSGERLDYDDDSFDIVLFSYVLHHAGDRAISLLRDAHRIARRYVIIAEDPKETDADCLWAYEDDRRGTFRGLAEWRALFSLLRFAVVHEAPLDCSAHSRHLFVLAPER
jgi:SAM-dependent methyltransferase